MRTIKPLGGQDGGPPPQSAPILFERQYTFYTPELTLLSETAPASSTTSTPAIQTEEMKHVADFQAFAKSIKDYLDLLEQTPYGTKGACDKGCAAAFDWASRLLQDRIRRVDASHTNYYGH